MNWSSCSRFSSCARATRAARGGDRSRSRSISIWFVPICFDVFLRLCRCLGLFVHADTSHDDLLVSAGVRYLGLPVRVNPEFLPQRFIFCCESAGTLRSNEHGEGMFCFVSDVLGVVLHLGSFSRFSSCARAVSRGRPLTRAACKGASKKPKVCTTNTNLDVVLATSATTVC